MHIYVCVYTYTRVRVPARTCTCVQYMFFFTNIVGVIRRVIIRAIQGNSFQAHRWKIYKYSIL